MKIKTSELTDAALDWAVWACVKPDDELLQQRRKCRPYSTSWKDGGPIIEREIAKIERFSDALWEATAFTKNAQDFVQNGPNPLVAAMRCYVASKLGYEVNIPEELA